MRRIALLNVAGGSCRTTSAVSLAGVFASTGRRVLLVDLDSGALGSQWLGCDPDQANLRAVLEEGVPLPSAIQGTSVDGLDVAVGWSWRQEVKPKAGHLRAEVEGLEGYDVVLIDCPMGINDAHQEILQAVGEVVVPFDSAPYVRSFDLTMELIDKARGANPALRLHGLLMCRDRAEEGQRTALLDRSPQLRDLLFDSTIPNDQGELDRALWAHLPVEQHAPDTPAAFAYRQAAMEIIG